MKLYSVHFLLLAGACASHTPPPATAADPDVTTVTTKANDVPAADAPQVANSPPDVTSATPADDKRASANSETQKATPPEPASNASDPENTRTNKRDANEDTKTPPDQGSSATDRRITQQIRQALVKDSSLSFDAKNVKIITKDGTVTLRGPVKTDTERTAVEAIARKVAGNAKIDNQIEVANRR